MLHNYFTYSIITKKYKWIIFNTLIKDNLWDNGTTLKINIKMCKNNLVPIVGKVLSVSINRF